MQSGTFTTSSPFNIRLPSFGQRKKAQARPRATAMSLLAEDVRSQRSLWTRMSHFLGDHMAIWASAGQVIPPGR